MSEDNKQMVSYKLDAELVQTAKEMANYLRINIQDLYDDALRDYFKRPDVKGKLAEAKKLYRKNLKG